MMKHIIEKIIDSVQGLVLLIVVVGFSGVFLMAFLQVVVGTIKVLASMIIGSP